MTNLIKSIEEKMDSSGNSVFWSTMKARVNAHNNLLMLGINDDDYGLLSRFLRGDNPDFDIMQDMTEEDIKKLELLTGPHAIAILKVGLLRQGTSLKLGGK
jgi:hypothetical protein